MLNVCMYVYICIPEIQFTRNLVDFIGSIADY